MASGRKVDETDSVLPPGPLALLAIAVVVLSVGLLVGCVLFWHWESRVFELSQTNAQLSQVSGRFVFLLGPRFFVEQNRILWATLPIKLGIPDNPEVLVLRIAPDR